MRVLDSNKRTNVIVSQKWDVCFKCMNISHRGAIRNVRFPAMVILNLINKKNAKISYNINMRQTPQQIKLFHLFQKFFVCIITFVKLANVCFIDNSRICFNGHE